jgi:hypothetical protein
MTRRTELDTKVFSPQNCIGIYNNEKNIFCRQLLGTVTCFARLLCDELLKEEGGRRFGITNRLANVSKNMKIHFSLPLFFVEFIARTP